MTKPAWHIKYCQRQTGGKRSTSVNEHECSDLAASLIVPGSIELSSALKSRSPKAGHEMATRHSDGQRAKSKMKDQHDFTVDPRAAAAVQAEMRFSGRGDDGLMEYFQQQVDRDIEAIADRVS